MVLVNENRVQTTRQLNIDQCERRRGREGPKRNLQCQLIVNVHSGDSLNLKQESIQVFKENSLRKGEREKEIRGEEQKKGIKKEIKERKRQKVNEREKESWRERGKSEQ